jgi:hypothetical protein
VKFEFRKRPGLTGREVRLLGLIGLAGLMLLGVLAGANIALGRLLPGGGGFFSAWEGARGFLFAHTEPYSGTIATLAQQQAYGRIAKPGEDPLILTVPFFLLPVYFPFALIPDPAVARGLWMLLGEAALVGIAFLSLRLIEWEPRRLFLIAYALLAVGGYYSVAALVEGTQVVFLTLIYLGVLVCLSAGQDELAGALLVLCLVHWEVSFLVLLLILWKVFSERRWRVLAGFGMLLATLLVISFLVYAGWIYPFLTATLAALRTGFGVTAASVFTRLVPSYGDRLAQAVTILIMIMLGYEWVATRDSDFRRFVWALCLTLAAAPLIGFRTEMSSLVAAFPGLALIFAAATNRWRMGYWLTGLLLLLVFAVPWSLFGRGILFRDEASRDLLFLFFPAFTILGLYWTRWWLIRPPRTWLDHIRAQG